MYVHVVSEYKANGSERDGEDHSGIDTHGNEWRIIEFLYFNVASLKRKEEPNNEKNSFIY